jgi:polysaccharide export outer membrane protein
MRELPAKRASILSAALVFSGLGLLSQTIAPPVRPLEPVPNLRSTYVLGPEDQIVIHASDVPDLSDKPLRLDPSGDINMPMVGRLHAAGLTTEQLEAELTRRLKVYLEHPEVAVTVAEFHSQPVSVLGEVTTPGVQQLQGRRSLFEVLSAVGGVRTGAGPSVRITRSLEQGRIPLPGAADDPTGRFSVAELDVKSILEGASPEKNIAIMPYDVITVPRAEIVYVMGEVGKAGPLVLSEGHSISVLQAVSSAGGVLRTAAAKRAMILRQIMGGPKRAELPVDLKKIMTGQANDVPLLSGDILFVPDSAGKRATARAVEAVVQFGTMAGTYGALR